jgi:protein TonB
VENMPEFPGGELALRKYLANSIRYPAIAQDNGVMGKVYVSFVINEEGKIEDVTLVRGEDSSLIKEALRVVSSMPDWKPGRQGGKAVKVRYNVPIVFQLR